MIPVYACRTQRNGGCGGITVRAEPVEEIIAARVIELVESSKFATMLSARRGESVDQAAVLEAERIEAQIAELEAAVDGSEHGLSAADFLRLRKPLVERLADARARMTDDTTTSAVGRFAGQTGELSIEMVERQVDDARSAAGDRARSVEADCRAAESQATQDVRRESSRDRATRVIRR
jgi:hypothetical protein